MSVNRRFAALAHRRRQAADYRLAQGWVRRSGVLASRAARGPESAAAARGSSTIDSWPAQLLVNVTHAFTAVM